MANPDILGFLKTNVFPIFKSLVKMVGDQKIQIKLELEKAIGSNAPLNIIIITILTGFYC